MIRIAESRDDIGRELLAGLGDGDVELPECGAVSVLSPAGTEQGARIRPIDELLGAPPMRWIVRWLVPAGAVGFIVAPPNAGKSLVALDWGLCAASAQDWHGRRVRAGSVVYFAGEGLAGMGARVRAWMRVRGVTLEHRFDVVDRLPPLDHGGTAELSRIVGEHAERHGSPSLVVIDTLATHWASSEDRAEHVGPAMAALAGLAQEYECGVLIVHHARKSQPGAPRDGWAALRGSGAWSAAADFVLALEPRGKALVLASTKQRDADRGPPIELAIAAVDLGERDEDGQAVTAAVLVPATVIVQEHTMRAIAEIVRERPGIGSREMRDAARAAGISRGDLDRELDALVEAGRVRRERQSRGRMAHYPSREAAE